MHAFFVSYGCIYKHSPLHNHPPDPRYFMIFVSSCEKQGSTINVKDYSHRVKFILLISCGCPHVAEEQLAAVDELITSMDLSSAATYVHNYNYQV